MMFCNPGVYFNKDEGKQLVEFAGLRFRNGTPSDIDGCFDCYGNGWIFIEIKRKGVEIQHGQKLMYERLARDLASGGKTAVVIIAEHNITDPEQNIPAKNCVIRKLCINGVWRNPVRPTTVEEAFNYYAPHISNNIVTNIA